MFFRQTISIFLILASFTLHASWREADSLLMKKMDYDKKLRALSIHLIEDGKYFSAIPWVKEFLIRGTKKLDSRFENSLSKLITVTGIKQFETLPLKYLRRSESGSIRYIIAKKYVKQNEYTAALSSLRQISSSSDIYPFGKNLEGTIYSLMNQFPKSILAFNSCVSASNKDLATSFNPDRLKLNRDYCLAGVARASFNAQKHTSSDLLYLDIPKSSKVWPLILFEEAWNSYYLKNYNRSLGKLVSYNAPVFDHIFNPEVDVLRALSYMKLCLYNDAQKVSDNFYSKYLQETRKLRAYIRRNKKDYDFFYKLMTNFESKGNSFFPLLTTVLKSVSGDQAFIDLKLSLARAIKEYDDVRSLGKSRLRSAALKNVEDTIITQKKIIGGYIRAQLISDYASLYKAFEGMSYIKLEVLAQVKAKLYSFEKKEGKRGDIKYIERNEKQYFWDFNGEFWADELGDYVFALKSEC